MATLWLFERMEDVTLDEPLPKKQKGASESIKISEENILTVTSMGFSVNQAKMALRKSVYITNNIIFFNYFIFD